MTFLQGMLRPPALLLAIELWQLSHRTRGICGLCEYVAFGMIGPFSRTGRKPVSSSLRR